MNGSSWTLSVSATEKTPTDEAACESKSRAAQDQHCQSAWSPVALSDGKESCLIRWIKAHRAVIWWVAGASVLVFIASLIVVPLLIVRIPSDYFAHRRRHVNPRVGRRSPLRWVLIVGKNLLGYVLVLAGLLMLFLPGQGVVTILIGITLLDFPGKYRFERWVVSRGPVLRSINRLRKRAGRPPLLLEE